MTGEISAPAGVPHLVAEIETPNDEETIEQFRAFLARCIEAKYHPNSVVAWFDGDVHLVAPAIAERTQFVVSPAGIEVAR